MVTLARVGAPAGWFSRSAGVARRPASAVAKGRQGPGWALRGVGWGSPSWTGQSQAFEGGAGGKSHTGKERLPLQCSHLAPPSPASSQGSVALVTNLKYAWMEPHAGFSPP